MSWGLEPHPELGYRFWRAYFPEVTIKYLHFNNSLRSAIVVGACSSATITNNVITNVRWGLYEAWYKPLFPTGVYRATGVVFSGPLVAPFHGMEKYWYNSPLGPGFNYFPPDSPGASYIAMYFGGKNSGEKAITGNIIIENNTIEEIGYDCSNVDPGIESESIAIGFLWGNANVEISNNDIQGVYRVSESPVGTSNAFFIYDNVKETFIERNTIEKFGGRGIRCINLHFNGKFYIEKNEMTSSSSCFTGINLSRVNDSVIRDNKIDVNTDPNYWLNGIYMYMGANNTIRSNKINGTASTGMCLYYSNTNVVMANNLNEFEPRGFPPEDILATHMVLLDSNDNTVVGRGGFVIDLGDNNTITGIAVQKPGHEIGQALREVLTRKQEMIEDY